MTTAYKIYCITESTFVQGYSNTLLTSCPNSGAHTVQAGSSSVVHYYNPQGIFGTGGSSNTYSSNTTLTGDV